MSTDYSWLICHPSKRDEKILQPLFEKAVKSAILLPQSQAVLQQWQQNPDHLFQDWKTETGCDTYNHFVLAFMIERFQQLWNSLATPEGKNGCHFSPDNCTDILSVNRCSIGAILAYGLGPQHFAQLPGLMGNIFLTHDEIPASLQTVNRTLEAVNVSALSERLQQLCPSNHTYSQALDIFQALPRELQRAQESHRGFMTIGMLMSQEKIRC